VEENRRETTLDRHWHPARAWILGFQPVWLRGKFSLVPRRSRLFWKGSAGGGLVLL
jgi:hypothetical protein